jgi:microcystin-dependent protein
MVDRRDIQTERELNLEARIAQLESAIRAPRHPHGRVFFARRGRILLAALVLVAVTATATRYVIAAANSPTPKLVPYRGVLKQNGLVVPNGAKQMTFRLYDQSGTGGNQIWGPEAKNVTVADGVFSVTLGDSMQLTDGHLQSPALWLDITVEGQSLTPRQQLMTTPYARRADVATAAANGVPSGTILPFGGSLATVPEGYLACDGSSVPTSQFPSLFAAIGTSWGTVDPSHFNVPDLRGVFLRGVDNGAGQDPDRMLRASSKPNGLTGDNVGTLETDTFRYHDHGGGSHTHNYTVPVYQVNTGSGPYPDGLAEHGGYSETRTSAGANQTVVQGQGGNETRPVNVNVNYIIKI